MANDDLQQKLWEAAARGDSAAVRSLAFIEDVDFDARDPYQRNALNIAAQYNHPDTMKTILAVKEARYLQSIGFGPDSERRETEKKKRSFLGRKTA